MGSNDDFFYDLGITKAMELSDKPLLYYNYIVQTFINKLNFNHLFHTFDSSFLNSLLTSLISFMKYFGMLWIGTQIS